MMNISTRLCILHTLIFISAHIPFGNSINADFMQSFQAGRATAARSLAHASLSASNIINQALYTNKSVLYEDEKQFITQLKNIITNLPALKYEDFNNTFEQLANNLPDIVRSKTEISTEINTLLESLKQLLISSRGTIPPSNKGILAELNEKIANKFYEICLLILAQIAQEELGIEVHRLYKSTSRMKLSGP